MKIIININDKLARFVKKACTTRNIVFTMAVMVFCAGLFIFSETVNIPNQLHEGDLIVAEELNENFQALRDRDLDSLADVDTGGAGEGQVLKYNGTSWEVGTDNTGGLGVWTESGNDIYWNGVGNVGIGTTDPGYPLEIVTPSETGIWVTSSNPSLCKLYLGQSKTPGQNTIFAHRATDNSTHIMVSGDDYTNGITISSSNNVGIGTDTPQGTLDVNGTIYQHGSQLHADYVFEEDYEIESIEDHSVYMWQEKHLPGVPAAQVDENGNEILEVGVHRKGMLEELEKAHVYIEQLYNEIVKLKAEIDELKAE